MLVKLLWNWKLMIFAALAGEVVLNVLLIQRVSYTEIDWQAYMDEVRPVVEEGEANYSLLRGTTGPLVYPGGFVVLYSGLYKVTEGAVRMAQYLHVWFYVALLAVVVSVYRRSPPSKEYAPVLLAVLCMSKRVHSIFVLRMFNDGPAMLFLWMAFWLFQRDRMAAGCLLFSVSLSIKMNALLVLPAVLLVLVVHRGIPKAILYLGACVVFQVLIGLPFIMYDSGAYFGAAFNFSRIFKQKWSVNFKWVPCEHLGERETLLEDCEGVFTSNEFGKGLLAAQLVVLSLFALRWVGQVGGPLALLRVGETPKLRFSAHQITTIFVTCQFVGVAFARSLHFQFYIWYFHSVHFLVMSLHRTPLLMKLLLLLAVEIAWNPWEGESSTVCKGGRGRGGSKREEERSS